jgi:hypothetical protein
MALTSEYELTPRELVLMETEKEEYRNAREHAIAMKTLELELSREQGQAEIMLKKLESKWASWLKLPKLIILSPVLLVLAIAYGFRREAPRYFWRLLE